MKKETKNEIDLTQTKPLSEALEILGKMEKRKFTESVDLDIVLRLKDNQKKESLKGNVIFPHQFGEGKKIVVLCEEKDIKKALEAGAIKAGLDDVKAEILGGLEFDVLIATPAVMPKIVELGKILGPKGLMPNPKNETITNDVVKSINSFKSGKVNFKMQSGQGVIRSKIGNTSMSSEDLKENIMAFLRAVISESRRLNSTPLKKVTLSKTMGAGIKLDVNDIMTTIK